MQAHLLRPEKKLCFTEKYFAGFLVQINTLIRRHEDADAMLDGILIHPMLNAIAVMGNNADAHHGHAQAVLLLYVQQNLGEPPGTFPTAIQLEHDPVGAIRDFSRATSAGTNGGLNPATGLAWIGARAWARGMHRHNVVYRGACKHVWETVVGTFTSAQAVTIIAGLPYGSGQKLLRQVKTMQQRQTTMALFTLFNQLINMQLAGGEGIAELYGRILEIRARLQNWDPPIALPDQLLIVCMLRLLPRNYHPTRTIIMSRDAITLKASKDMLLDVENRDAERVAAAVGSRGAPRAHSNATALVTYDSRQKYKPKKKQYQPKRKGRKEPFVVEKSPKYRSEGACSYHGSRAGHASSECYVLHPELKPTAAVANAEALAITTAPKPLFGFMNNEWGYALTVSGEEVNSAGEQQCVLVVDLRRGVYGVGKHSGSSHVPLGVYEFRPSCYPGGIQAGGHPLAHVVSRLIDTRAYERIILRGFNSAGIGTKLMVPRAIVSGIQTPLASNVRSASLGDCYLLTKDSLCPFSVHHLVSPVPTQEILERACVSNDTQIADICTKALSRRTIEFYSDLVLNNTTLEISTQQPEVDSVHDEATEPHGRQIECGELIQWLVQTAKVPYWKVLHTMKTITIRGVTSVFPDKALLSISNFMNNPSWHWPKQQCLRLSNTVSADLHAALVEAYIDGTVHVPKAEPNMAEPNSKVGVHISSDPLLGINFITTAVLCLWNMDIPPTSVYNRYAPEDDWVTIDVVMTPCTIKEGLSLPRVQFRLIDSKVPAVVISGTETLMWAQHLTQCINAPLESSTTKNHGEIGYAMMMTSGSEEGNYAFMNGDAPVRQVT